MTEMIAATLEVQAADMYASGSSFSTIGKELDVSKSRVGDLIRGGIDYLKNNHLDGEHTVLNIGERVIDTENDGLIIPDYEDNPDLSGVWEKTLLIKATPILRKVVLNSKVFLQHEYFQKHLGYEKDVGDLLVEALDYYWKEMGFTIKITHDSVM